MVNFQKQLVKLLKKTTYSFYFNIFIYECVTLSIILNLVKYYVNIDLYTIISQSFYLDRYFYLNMYNISIILFVFLFLSLYKMLFQQRSFLLE